MALDSWEKKKQGQTYPARQGYLGEEGEYAESMARLPSATHHFGKDGLLITLVGTLELRKYRALETPGLESPTSSHSVTARFTKEGAPEASCGGKGGLEVRLTMH